jgi:hypothetical protein
MRRIDRSFAGGTRLPRTVPDMSTPVPARRGRLLPSLVLGAAVAAAVAIVGWMLLLFVKGAVVVVGYALGAALIALPLLLARRILAGHSGRERWQRVSTIAQVVVLGAVLCAVAHLLGQHGWLLVAVPVAVVLAGRLLRTSRLRRRPAVR